jgi:hypothetical protein
MIKRMIKRVGQFGEPSPAGATILSPLPVVHSIARSAVPAGQVGWAVQQVFLSGGSGDGWTDRMAGLTRRGAVALPKPHPMT